MVKATGLTPVLRFGVIKSRHHEATLRSRGDLPIVSTDDEIATQAERLLAKTVFSMNNTSTEPGSVAPNDMGAVVIPRI
jgi:hypothetical protein